jgi:hypothetical protein
MGYGSGYAGIAYHGNTASNYAFLMSPTVTYVNAPAGGTIYCGIANTDNNWQAITAGTTFPKPVSMGVASPTAGRPLLIQATVGTDVPLAVMGGASQSGSLLQVLNSSGALLAQFNQVGNLALNNPTGASIGLAPTGGGQAAIDWNNGTQDWTLYINPSDSNLYLRDQTNARMQVQFYPAATSDAANTVFNSYVSLYSQLRIQPTSGGQASLSFLNLSGGNTWWLYQPQGDPSIYLRDMVNSRMHVAYTPGATNNAAITNFYSSVQVNGLLGTVSSLNVGGSGSFSGGSGPMIFLANDTADPTSAPSGGGILYSSAGVLTYRAPTGLPTLLGPMMTVQNGESNAGLNGYWQVRLGYYNGGYNQFIRSRHNTAVLSNAIDFYTYDGVSPANNTPQQTILGASIDGGMLCVGAFNPGPAGAAGPMLYLANDTGDPTASASGGTLIYSSAGVLKARTPDGSVTQIAPATNANVVAPLVLTAPTATTVPLTIKGAASQSSQLLSFQNSAGTALAYIDQTGSLGIVSAPTSIISLAPAGGGGCIYSWNNGTQGWWLYSNPGDINLYLRDTTKARMQAYFTPGANSNTAVSYFQSAVYSEGGLYIRPTSGSYANLQFQNSAGANKWWFYVADSTSPANLYIQDAVNARTFLILEPGASSSASLAYFAAGIQAEGNLTLAGGSGQGLSINTAGQGYIYLNSVSPPYMTIAVGGTAYWQAVWTASYWSFVDVTRSVSQMILWNGANDWTAFAEFHSTIQVDGGTINLIAPATGHAVAVNWMDTGSALKWQQYLWPGDGHLYLTDSVGGRIQVAYGSGATDAAALTEFHSRVTTYSSLTVNTSVVSNVLLSLNGPSAQTGNFLQMLANGSACASFNNTGTLTLAGVTGVADAIVSFAPVSGRSAVLVMANSDGLQSYQWYMLPGDHNMYFRDLTNAKMQVIYRPGATSTAASTEFLSNVTVDGSLAVLAGSTTLVSPTSGSAILYWQNHNTTLWAQYINDTQPQLYIRDWVNSRMHVTFTPGATAAAATTTINSQLVTQSNITVNPGASTDANIIINNTGFNGDNWLTIYRGGANNERLRFLAAGGGGTGLNNVYTIDRINSATGFLRDLQFRTSEDNGSTYALRLNLTGAGDVAVGGTGKITTALTELILEQTGDGLGTLRFHIQNRGGQGGPLIEQVPAGLPIDLGFLSPSISKTIMRMEVRSGNAVDAANSAAGMGEWQFFSNYDNLSHLWAGHAGAGVLGRFSIGGAGNPNGSGSWSGGSGPMLFLANSTADPTSAPTGGTLIYSSSNILKARTPDGAITQLAPVLYKFTYTQTLTAPTVVSSPYTISHGLNTTTPIVQIWDAVTLQLVQAQVVAPNASSIQVSVTQNMPNNVNVVVMGTVQSPAPVQPTDVANKSYVDARTPNLPAPVTSGSGVQSFTDVLGDVWVAANGVSSGAWKRATNVLHGSYYRNAAWNAVTANALFTFDTLVADPYGLYSGGIVTLPIAGIWSLNVGLGSSGGASAWLNASIRDSLGNFVWANQLISTPGSFGLWAACSCSRPFNAGDKNAVFESGSTTGLVGQTGTANHFNFDYVGTG